MIQRATRSMADEMLHVINVSNQACYEPIIPKAYFTAPYLSMQTLLAQFDDMIFYVARRNDSLTGVVALQLFPEYIGRVAHLYVLPAYHRQGIGTALMDHVHQEATRHELTRLRLRVGEKAVWATKFYRILGYTCRERCQCPEGWVLVMEKKLLPYSHET